MWRRSCFALLGAFVAATCLAAGGSASGQVLDARSGAPIPNARVEVVASEIVATTNREGRFELAAVLGQSRVRILAPGYQTRELRLVGEFVEILLEREEEAVFAEVITVRGPVAGSGEGLRVDDSLSHDALERQPNTSAAEVLERMAGAFVQRDRGEADRILIRGAEARLVSTTLDGERLASPEGDARTAGIGLIPADLLEEVQVSKTITPDMDGDAIGGVVNLVTRKAPPSGLRSVDLSSGWDSEAEDQFGAGSFALGRRFADDRLGVMLSASSHNADRGADQLEARYRGETMERIELRDYDFTRERQGLATTIDYSPQESIELRAKGFFSSLATDELRRRVKFDLGANEIERELKDAHLERDIASATFGGDHLLKGRFQVDYKLGAQRARQDEPDRIDTSFIQQEVNFSSSGLQPAPSNEDVTRFRFDKIGVEDNQTQEEDFFAAVNLSAPLRSDRGGLGLFRAGLKIRDKTKSQDTNTTIFEPEGDIVLTSFVDPEFLGRGFLRGRYDFGSVVDRIQARNLIDRFGLEGRLSFEEEAADYTAGEATAAGYAMTELTLGERFSLLPGVRYEQTTSDYQGFEVIAADTLQESSARNLQGAQSYGVWLPGIHAAYRVNGDFVLRGAVTRSLARPDYFDLVPFRILDFEDAELELGNADLRPTRSWNLDLGLEWHPSSSSEFALAFFHKKMADFIYTQRGTEEVEAELFELTRPANGHHAVRQGIEASLRHRFGAGPRLLEGFALELHLTGTNSSAEVDEFESTSFRLPGQASNSGQLLLSYDKGTRFGSLSLGYVGDYLLELGADRSQDVYFNSQLRLDLAAGYSPTSWARFYLHLNNVTDEPLRLYQGSPDRLYRVEYTGWSMRLGLKLRF